MTVTLGQPLAPDRAVLDELLNQIAVSGRWSNDGPLVRQLEAQIAADLGWSSVAATSSGTAALTLALLALDLPFGSEVITSPLTFPATVQAIEMAGQVPVFASVDPDSLCLDPASVRAAISPTTSAIVPVHLFGVAADRQLDDIGISFGLPVVYDAAHAYDFAPVVGRGTATAYSLHATKLLHTAEGGLVATNDSVMADNLRLSRAFGLHNGVVTARGTNAKMAELNAALGLAVMPHVPGEVAARQRLRNTYEAALANSSRYRAHAVGRSRALVMEFVRCHPRDQQHLLDELATHGVIGRSFPALCAPGQRYTDVRLVGSAPDRMVDLAHSGVAIPLHSQVTDAAVESITQVLGR